MRKRYRIGIAILLVFVLGGIAWVILLPSEPIYEGKTLSVWLDSYDPMNSLDTDAEAKEQAADEAVRKIGTNAIPTLMSRLRAHDAPLLSSFKLLVNKRRIFHIELTLAFIQNGEGERGFSALGEDGKDAVPELIAMCEKTRFQDSKSDIVSALGDIGPSAKQAVPLLLRCLDDTDRHVCAAAARALGSIHAESALVVPALAKCLGNHDHRIRSSTARALGQFGADAKSAVPALVKLLTDTDPMVKDAAMTSLKTIDPEAAAKAGVK
jgi:HEAT repeat protein